MIWDWNQWIQFLERHDSSGCWNPVPCILCIFMDYPECCIIVVWEGCTFTPWLHLTQSSLWILFLQIHVVWRMRSGALLRSDLKIIALWIFIYEGIFNVITQGVCHSSTDQAVQLFSVLLIHIKCDESRCIWTTNRFVMSWCVVPFWGFHFSHKWRFSSHTQYFLLLFSPKILHNPWYIVCLFGIVDIFPLFSILRFILICTCSSLHCTEKYLHEFYLYAMFTLKLVGFVSIYIFFSPSSGYHFLHFCLQSCSLTSLSMSR